MATIGPIPPKYESISSEPHSSPGRPDAPSAIMLSRARGAFMGCAIADSLGAAVEFRPPGSFRLVDLDTFDNWGEYPNPHGIKPGVFTDDTSMALALGESILQCRGFHPAGTFSWCVSHCASHECSTRAPVRAVAADQIARYRRWWHANLYKPDPGLNDIGGRTRASLSRKDALSQPLMPLEAGVGPNGCIMRLVPVPLALVGEADVGRRASSAATSARTTHPDVVGIQAAILMTEIIRAAVLGEEKASLLTPGRWSALFDDPAVQRVPGSHPVDPRIKCIIDGAWKRKRPAASPQERGHPSELTELTQIAATFSAARCLEAALWSLDTTGSFAEGAIAVVNLGDDSDTVGAIYGQIAGAVYSDDGIPAKWLSVLKWRHVICAQAEQLVKLGVAGELRGEGRLPGARPGAVATSEASASDADELALRNEAAQAAFEKPWPELMTLLRAHPHLVNNTRPGGTSGFTPLHQAAFRGAPAYIVAELLALGADPRALEAHGRTPLQLCLQRLKLTTLHMKRWEPAAAEAQLYLAPLEPLP